MEGIYPQTYQLQGLATTTKHHGGSVVQGPTPWDRTYFSGPLVLAESAPSVCPLWRQYSDALKWSEAVHWVWLFWSLLGDVGQDQALPVF